MVRLLEGHRYQRTGLLRSGYRLGGDVVDPGPGPEPLQTPATIFGSDPNWAEYSPWDPSTLWKNTDGTDPVTADGDVVARIDDISGNGRHRTQNTVASQPVYGTGSYGSRLIFDGVDDFMSLAGIMLVGTNYSVHAAWRLSASPAAERGWVVGGMSTSDNLNLHFGRYDGATIRFDQWKNGVDYLEDWTPEPIVASAILRSDGRFLRVGGVQRATSTNLSQLGSWNGAAIARRRTSDFAPLELYSLILRAGDTSDADALAIEQYQAAKAGVTL